MSFGREMSCGWWFLWLLRGWRLVVGESNWSTIILPIKGEGEGNGFTAHSVFLSGLQ